MMENIGYNQTRMVAKLKQKGGDIYPSANTGNYIEQLQRVYNSGARSGKIYFA